MRAGDGADGMADQVRALSGRKLAEVEEMLARVEAMKGWLAVANTRDCETPEECSLFPAPGEAADALRIVQVHGHCRRAPDPAAGSNGVRSRQT